VDRGWTWAEARTLRAGDSVWIGKAGKTLPVDSVRSFETTGTPVYNFEVEGVHTYLVGRQGIAVHNACTTPSAGSGGGEKGIGGKGWVGDKTWKGNVKDVGTGGTIRSLNGQVPTRLEAVRLINESKGKVLRIEGPHEAPNPHNFSHINYETPSGGKGTIEISDF
jgi:hypothetical protein